jgi:hypothetical protein
VSREVAIPRTFNVVATLRMRNGETRTAQGEIHGPTLDAAMDTDDFDALEGDTNKLTDDEKIEVAEITLRIWEA